MSKILTIFGATGNQGGNVIDTVLADPVLSKEFKIRAITRDTTKPKAKALADRGVEVVSADMSSKESAAPAVQGAHTVFLVTNFWESMSAETEIAQGKAVTDASKEAGVKHLIFSSLIHVTEASKGKLTHVTHFDGKADIEKYIRASGVPATFVLPGFFMLNYFQFLNKNEDGSYTYAVPCSVDKAQVPLFDAANDTGKFVVAAIKHFPAQSGKQILAATEYVTPKQLAADFAEASGKACTAVQVDEKTWKSFLPEAIAQEMLENMLLLEDPGYYAGADLAPSLALLDQKPTTWKEFVAANKEKWA
ncbi:Nucleoside-diphosphate-sugar epimerase [Geosmithia morbida]|uniref:Nucleoside-diphosphate-sugar epimerase n=1 Tax=Geosmithia morbida TaxID=1094350 RepID=A0A9P5D723_9HYPO|nr:Nucleoside-diphosphate-sugar epimerase [Geosmithia morbida]KAF4126166.1 Nucleoside-diphosphate-sugar epimerase [Geosmithia morbida]